MSKFKFGDKVWHDEFGVCIYHHSLGYKNMCRVITERDGSKKVSENNITKVSDWIQCSERMPPKNGVYLCILKSKNNDFTHVTIVDFYDDDFDVGIASNVIGWMPLPAPPKD